jgi:hypothetical protein
VFYSATLPECCVVPGEVFQTKSPGCGMDRYTITAQGRLVLRRCTSSDPASAAADTAEPATIASDVVDTEYHGDPLLVGLSKGSGLTEYVARFTHGTLERIRAVEILSEIQHLVKTGSF